MCATCDVASSSPAYHCVVVALIDCAGTTEDEYCASGPNWTLSTTGAPATISALLITVMITPWNCGLTKQLVYSFAISATTSSLSTRLPWTGQSIGEPSGML